MGRRLIYCLTMIAVLAIAACGGRPEPQRRAESRSHNTPVPLPTRSSASVQDLDVAALFPEYRVFFSGPYWVQLDHLEIEGLTIAIGVEPSFKGPDLQKFHQEHQEEMNHPPGTRRRDSGDRESEVLGSLLWSWGTIEDGDQDIDQLALFAAHPTDSSLLIARSESLSEEGGIQDHLDELIRIAEIIGPTL